MSSYNRSFQVEAYLWEHHRQRSLRGRKYDTIPFVHLSGTIATGNDRRSYGDFLVLHITWIRKMGRYIFLLYFVNLGCLLLGRLLPPSGRNLLALYMGMASILTTGVVIVWEMCFAKQYRKTIYLDRKVIRIHKEAIPWASIAEVYFMDIRRGRSTRHFLLLRLRDGAVQEYDVDGFLLGKRRLAFAIEHYRTQAQWGVAG